MLQAAEAFVPSLRHSRHTSQRVNALKVSDQGEKKSVLSLAAKFIDRKSRPAQINVPRARINLQFAVQLMRNSYNAIDWLDFVAMDEFQKAFFLYRQDEWEDYKGQHPNIMQGDLADANYFDFISLAQYTVTLEEMKTAKKEFIERYNAVGDTRVVRRNQKYLNNNVLPDVHSRAVGQKLLDYFYATYTEIMPKPSNSEGGNENRLPYSQFIQNAQSIMDIFSINNFCIATTVRELTPDSAQDDYAVMEITLKVPATLWSGTVLRTRKAQLQNDFEIKVLEEYARRVGLELSVINTKVVQGLEVVHMCKITQATDAYKRLPLWEETPDGGILIQGVPGIYGQQGTNTPEKVQQQDAIQEAQQQGLTGFGNPDRGRISLGEAEKK